MGRAHANTIARLPMFFPDARTVRRQTLIGRDEEVLARAADRPGFEQTATDWRGTIDDTDVFYNLGPNHLHEEPTTAALNAGIPVLCEKPLAPTLGGAQRMAEAAANADVPTACTFNYQFLPAIQYPRNLIQSGKLGEIHHVRGRYLQDWLVDPDEPWSWRNSAERAGSGAPGDLGSHTLDLVQFLVGDTPGGGDIERMAGQLQTFVDERQDGLRERAHSATAVRCHRTRRYIRSLDVSVIEQSPQQ